jgi:putative endonuclease
MEYSVYILECRDGSLYTGIARDLKDRLEMHSRGRGSRYVRSRLPFRLVYSEQLASRSEALKRELEIKSMDRSEKKMLVNRSSL